MNTGSFAFDTVNRTKVQILDRIEAWGYVSYRVFDPSSGKVDKLAENQLSEDGGTNIYDENYLRYCFQKSKMKLPKAC